MSAPRLARGLIAMVVPRDRRDDMLGDLEETHRRRAPRGRVLAWITTVFDAVCIAVLLSGERARMVRPAAPWRWTAIRSGARIWTRRLGQVYRIAVHGQRNAPGDAANQPRPLPPTHRDITGRVRAERLAGWLRPDDFRFGLRMFWREPLTSVTATIALTVGIGLTTVGFATAEALLFSELPFEGGDRFVLVNVLEDPERRPARLEPEQYGALAAQERIFDHLGAGSQSRENLTLPSGGIEEATTAALTPSSLRMLPFVPIRGRLLAPGDAVTGAPPVAMIREAFWRRAFGGSETAVGATIDVGGVARTIVGVMPDEFQFPSRPPALWTPMSEAFLAGRGAPPLNARLFGRLAPGVSIAAAQVQLQAVAGQLGLHSRTPSFRIEVVAFTDLGPNGGIVGASIVIVVLAVLVVVAANVANLVLARSFGRARELAVRAALGASRARLVAQISTEVFVLCGIAALVGGAAAQAILRQFNTMDDLPFWLDFRAGPGTASLVAGATLLATTIAGAWPALRATRQDLLGTLQAGGARTGGSPFGPITGVMAIAQITVSIVMLHGALVVAHGAAQYARPELGLPANVLTAGLRFGGTSALSQERTPLISDEVAETVARVPGVIAAGLTTALPRHSPPVALVEIEPLTGELVRAPRSAPSAEVSAGYFSALEARVLVGRDFMADDYRPDAPAVAIVNTPFVQEFLGGAYPIGRRIRTTGSGGADEWREIVGVVPDLGLSIGDPSLAAGYYVPLRAAWMSAEPRFVYLAVRVDGNPLAFAGPLRAALHERDPGLVLNRLQRLDEVAGEDRAFFTWLSRALLGLGVVTLLLAITGVYAMMALMVARRTREIGVRMALGATAQRVTGTVLRRAAWQVGLGGGLGAMLALLSLDLRHALVSRLDDGGPWTLPLVLGLLVTAGLSATYVPLRRALRVQPAESLRAE